MSEEQKEKESNNNAYEPLLPTILDEMIEYIENTDQQIEWEWGSCRGLQEVIDANDMPDIYYKLIALKDRGNVLVCGAFDVRVK